MPDRAARVLYTEHALGDLDEIERFIALDDPIAAARWVEGLMTAAERAGDHPLSGRIVPEFDRDDIREIIHRNYRIVHRIVGTRIEVLTIFEGHRRMPSRGV